MSVIRAFIAIDLSPEIHQRLKEVLDNYREQLINIPIRWVVAPQELVAILNGIETATARLGYAREERAFSPHLTLGRVSRNATSYDVKTISQTLDQTRVGFLGATCVAKIHLYI